MTTTRTGGRKGRWPEPTAEQELAWEAELELAWERFKVGSGLSGSMDAHDEAERRAAVYEGALRGRLREVDPEAARLDAEYNAASERGDEGAMDAASGAFEKKFRKFRDRDKGFAEVKRRAAAAVRAYNAAMRAEEGDDEEGDDE